MTTKTSAAPEQLLGSALRRCNQHLSDGDLPSANAALSEAITLWPTNADLLTERGRLELLQRNVDRAQADFSSALRLDARHAAAHAGLARCHFERSEYRAAESGAQRALAFDPSTEEAVRLLSAPSCQAPEAKSHPEKSQSLVTKAIQSTAALQDFHARAADFFADVQPPALTELQLQNGRLLPCREQLLPIMPKRGICAEIGTQTGGFAKRILSILEPAKFHIVDIDFSPFDLNYFQPHIDEGQVQLHQGDSSSVLARFPDKHFDFIYVDGDHAYSGVKRDLDQAALKIKDEGWVVCNDYTVYSPLEQCKYGVQRAVNEFCLNHNFEIRYLALHPWGYHDVALRKRIPRNQHHLGGAFLDAPDPNTFMPDVWEYLIQKYRIRSVLDLGAGAGWSTKWFLKRGLEAMGIEGWQDALDASQCRSHIVRHDFTLGSYVPQREFDLCWCSEFVEHVEERFIPNFMAAAQRCRYVCLTHGEVGQEGHHHVNCQPLDYWVKQLALYGFAHADEETLHLRKTYGAESPWGRKTLAFFARQKETL